jgi:F-type H+-transporting ATPase subunit epsilon
MAQSKAVLGGFKLLVMDPDKKIYEGEVKTVFLSGDYGEFELLAHHYPVFSLLKAGDIVIDWEKSISIKAGIVKFFKNDCVILVELSDEEIKKKL